jgi:hypothetical protein
MEIANSFGIAVWLILIDDPPHEVSGFENALQMSDSPVIHMKHFADSFPERISLLRGLLPMFLNVPGILCSSAAREIFRDLPVQLVARLTINNFPLLLAAYSLTLPRQDEVQKCGEGYSSRGPDIGSQDLFRVSLETRMLKADFQEEIPYQDIIIAVFQMVVNSESIIGETECPFSAFASNLAASESHALGEYEHKKFRQAKHFTRTWQAS